MSPTASRNLLFLVAILQLGSIGMLVALWTKSGTEESALPEEVTDLAEELSATRYQLEEQLGRLTRTLDRQARQMAAPAAAAGEGAGGAADEPKSALDLLARLHEVNDLHDRYQDNPLQRDPIEKERGRLEAELRARGEESMDAIAATFAEIDNTREQTRLLMQVVGPIGSPAALDFAERVFDNPNLTSGVRLVGAHLAGEKRPDSVIPKLVRLLEEGSDSFNRRDEIATFFAGQVDARAEPVLAKLAADTAVERDLRRACIRALRSYPNQGGPVLEQIAEIDPHTDLRIEAIHTLNYMRGRDVVDFVRHLRSKVSDQDPVRQLLDSIEAQWDS